MSNKIPQFVHLHTHTHFSLLDGLTKIDELIETAKNDGAPAVAITDHGVMYGVIEFYQKCKKAGIKPIIGVEFYMAKKSRLDKVTKDDEKRNYHLLLLAKNEEGYKNLIKLTSIAHLEGYYYKPRIDWEVLEKHSNGLIACTACLGGEIQQLILANKLDKAEKRILDHNKLFGQDNFYLELQDHQDIPEQKVVNEKLIEFSRKLNVPVVATNDLHYLREEDADAQDILLCMQTKNKKDTVDRFRMHGTDFYYKPAVQMHELFRDVPEAIENTVKIADKCNLEIELGNIQLPHFDLPEGLDDKGYLEKLCKEGIKKRFNINYDEASKEIKERMDYEISVISKMGWPAYFFIVADFVNWAKENGIMVGPGRGSAAGSLICYLLGITNLDPIKYDLLFERFLNPDRISMPDIDLDFADTGRDRVIRYVEDKYGKDHVSQIITFGTMAARAAIRDVGRVLDHPYDYCDKLAKMVPMFSTLNDALENTQEFKDIYAQEAMAQEIINLALRLEGVSRHASTHACGVLITKNPLTDYAPLQYSTKKSDIKDNGDGKKSKKREEEKSIVSQYSLHPVEDLGLLKMDFLGLKNLSIIESAVNLVKTTLNIDIDIEKIPLDDEKTYKLFQKGETTGVFQFESSGMKRYLRELKPTEFEDIIAMVALYRPGPMEWIPDYISGKHKKRRISYLHQKLEPILSKTHGVAIYQEQVMQMARELAGFTMAQADVLRKAVGKKIVELLEKQKEKFIQGCVKNEINENLAKKIFAFIEPFAGYGFNRSHAACYAMIGYQTAYLKAHYPEEFMAALLTADQENIDRVAIEIDECRQMGIKVLEPDINESFETFTVVNKTPQPPTTAPANGNVEKKNIRFGLKAIKNVGANISEIIIKEREGNGKFKDITDLLERVTDKDLNKKSLESLIKSGSMSCFGERGQLLANIENILAFSKEITQQQDNGQVSLFGDVPSLNVSNKIKLNPATPVDRQEKLAWEKELLGLYISDHPFLDYKKYLDGITVSLNRLKDFQEKNIVIAGMVSSVKKINTRKGDAMLFVKFEDNIGTTEILVFPRLLKDTSHIWEEGKAVICYGKVSPKDKEIKFLGNKAINLNLDMIEADIKKFQRKVPSIRDSQPRKEYKIQNPLKIILNQECSSNDLNKLKNIFLENGGNDKIYFKDLNGQIIELGLKVNNNEILQQAIQKDFGEVVSIKV